MQNDTVRKLISRTIEGVETLVNTEPAEIFIDVPALDARYIRVREGETVREGDIRSRTEAELESPPLRKWTIEEIGTETVVGTDRTTGETREWDRESLERQLATGGLSTELTDFERVNVIGGAGTLGDGVGPDSDHLIVAAYGDDGRKFTRTYRITADAGDDGRAVELMGPAAGSEPFEPDIQDRFERQIERALRNEGYAA